MELTSFLRVLLRRKWLILAICSVAMLTTFLIVRQTPSIYASTAQLSTGILEGENTAFAADRIERPQRYEVEARFKNLEEMIRSPQVLSLVSYRLLLHDLKQNEPFRDLTPIRSRYSTEDIRIARQRLQTKSDSLQSLLNTDELERKHIDMLAKMGYGYEQLKQTLRVRRIPGTDYIGITFKAESPHLAAFVVNTLSQEFIRYHADIRTGRAQDAISFFARLVEEKKSELDEKMLAWEKYQESQGRKVTNDPLQQIMAEIRVLEQERERANELLYLAERNMIELQDQLTESEKQPYLSSENTRGTSLAQLLHNRLIRLTSKYVQGGFRQSGLDSLRLTKQELSDALFNEAEAGGGANFSLRAELIRKKINAELDLELARERIKAINEELSRLGNQSGTFTTTSSSSYGKEVEVARDAYLLVLNKLNEAKLSTLDVVSGDISQVAFVQPPEQPEPSQTGFLTVLSGLVSLALCVIVLFMMEYLDSSIRYPSQFTPQTGLALIGPLNRLNTTNLDLVSLFSEAQSNETLENYKQLMRNIRFGVLDAGAKRFMVTSTRGGAGKTSLLISLAYSLSLNEKRVLLIDTNFKNNSLTQITAASPSLEQYIHKDIPRKSLVSSSVFDGVDVIGCEGGSFSPAEIFRKAEFKALLEELSQNYDVIFMEGPELNTYADTKEMLDFTERILPVFSATAGINAADKASIEFLKAQEGKLMGAVLNKVEVRDLKL